MFNSKIEVSKNQLKEVLKTAKKDDYLLLSLNDTEGDFKLYNKKNKNDFDQESFYKTLFFVSPIAPIETCIHNVDVWGDSIKQLWKSKLVWQ